MGAVLSTPAKEYLASHGISAEVAERYGAEVGEVSITYPNGRVRQIGGNPPMIQPQGTPIVPWVVRGTQDGSYLVTEGESDALAAATALPDTPPQLGLNDAGIVSVPGSQFPPQRLAAELKRHGARQVYLAGDGDDAGRKFMQKTAPVLAQAEITVYPVNLPDDDDLAEYIVRNGAEGLANLLADAPVFDPRPGIDACDWLGSSLEVDAVWGIGHSVLWAAGEPLYVVAGPSMGKSTLGQQLALRRCGAVSEPLLNFSVNNDEREVLYLAMDRPRQALRSMRRMIDEYDVVRGRIRIWDRSPPFAISATPEKLLPWVQSFGDIGTVFVDSLFNIAPRLANEEGSANTNNALQMLVRNNVEVCVIHHDRKRLHGEKPRLDDLFGMRPISAGAGSILYLDGEPGTLKAKLLHMKPPVNRVPAFDIRQDPRSGLMYAAADDEPEEVPW